MSYREKIGIWWFEHKLVLNDKEGFIWWGVCKKTKKVAFCDVTNLGPLIIQDTHIENNKCFDHDCLNYSCSYCQCQTLLEAMKKTCFKEIGIDEKRIKFIKNAEQYIEQYLQDLSKEELQEHLIDGYDCVSITMDALTTKYELEE